MAGFGLEDDDEDAEDSVDLPSDEEEAEEAVKLLMKKKETTKKNGVVGLKKGDDV